MRMLSASPVDCGRLFLVVVVLEDALAEDILYDVKLAGFLVEFLNIPLCVFSASCKEIIFVDVIDAM